MFMDEVRALQSLQTQPGTHLQCCSAAVPSVHSVVAGGWRQGPDEGQQQLGQWQAHTQDTLIQ